MQSTNQVWEDTPSIEELYWKCQIAYCLYNKTPTIQDRCIKCGAQRGDPGAECKIVNPNPLYVQDEDGPPFKDGDNEYSQQGKNPVCTYHALSKALVRLLLLNNVKFSTRDMVIILSTYMQTKGADGSNPTDFDGFY